MNRLVVCGLAAFAMVAVPAAAGFAAPTNADTTKCNTDYFSGGSETTCNIFTDDGGWDVTTTYCDNNGNCTAH